MELAELTAYAAEKYNIREEHRWADFPGFSVLCDPHTGKWAALLMRQWDTDTGTQIELCDLKCGKQSLAEFRKPYLSAPVRMFGSKWIGVSFDERTEPDVIFRLFDRAVTSGEQRGFTIALEPVQAAFGKVFKDTKLPFSGSAYSPPKEVLPEKLRQMRRLFEYGKESSDSKAKNFYRQGIFMEKYEDNVPWDGDFVCYFPTYHDLTTKQLRGYFSWRTLVRKGEFRPITASAAYIYIYELLNGIGASSPEDGLQKLKAFETGFLDSGIGDTRMRQNLHRWMLDFAVINELPPETAAQYIDQELLQKDAALAVLRHADRHTDEEVFEALCRLGGRKLADSPVIKNDPARGMRLFAEVWRTAQSNYYVRGKDLFTQCFGKMRSRLWYPLANTVYYHRSRPEAVEYRLDECRIFRCKDGIWQVRSYDEQFFDKNLFKGFLRETDLRLRRYLKTGRYLKEKPEDEWASLYVDVVIREEQREILEASRPKITIDLSGLDQIRADALTTRDSLLTEEELAEMEADDGADDGAEEAAEAIPDLPLDDILLRILRAVLRDEPVEELIRTNHLMPSLAADAINEAMFDEIGDNVLDCEGDKLSIVEDYREDLMQILGGTER